MQLEGISVELGAAARAVGGPIDVRPWIDSGGDGLIILIAGWCLLVVALVLLVSAVLGDDQENKP